ncbi:asparaginase [Dasania marina]|uniref:asparaginase n=1 Tax=Dasania marina TaxID=471499 RepID=UPI0030DBF3CB|tara:strand:+ start:24500 stop:25519 length:1020 start_codon:yes stop_codon:yes gene_type:complete
MTKPSIYVAYTGGTIGMQQTAQGFAPVAGFLTSHIKTLPEFYHEAMPEFVIKEYDPLIDSANAAPADWQIIADDIAANYQAYDGFVILHGTDTMAYTASALSFVLQGLAKPVIITGSQIPLAQPHSDGPSNLSHALYLAAKYPAPEVCVFFNKKLLRGNRSTKVHTEDVDAFASPNYPPLLETDSAMLPLPEHQQKSLTATNTLSVANISPQPISIFTLYPGVSTELLDAALQQPIKALILQSYGAGNAPQHAKFIDALAAANQRGVIIINLSQCLQGSVNMAVYATGKALADAGVLSGYDMTLEATITKLHFLLSQNMPITEVKLAMKKNVQGELSDG